MAHTVDATKPATLEQAVEDGHRMVRAIAYRYVDSRNDLEDLYQVGMLGLMDAWRTYDPHRGAFPTHAYVRVRAAIRNYKRDHGHPMKIGRGLAWDFDAHPWVGSLWETVDNGEDELPRYAAHLYEDFDLDQVEHDWQLSEVVEAMEDTLSERERRMVWAYYCQGQSGYAIAQAEGCAQMEVSRTCRAAVVRLRLRLGVPDPDALDRLTDTEREAMSWLARGLGVVEVARRMGIPKGTVSGVLGAASQKLVGTRRYNTGVQRFRELQGVAP